MIFHYSLRLVPVSDVEWRRDAAKGLVVGQVMVDDGLIPLVRQARSERPLRLEARVLVGDMFAKASSIPAAYEEVVRDDIRRVAADLEDPS